MEASANSASWVNRKVLIGLSRWLLFTELLSNIMLGFIIIKSYFYVFSRIAFSEENNLFVDLKNNPKSFENGELTLPGSHQPMTPHSA